MVIEQLKRTGNALVSGSELVIALQNESERELALSLYANPDKGRLHAIPYSDEKHITAYEILATERKEPYTVRVADRGYPNPSVNPSTAFGFVRILD